MHRTLGLFLFGIPVQNSQSTQRIPAAGCARWTFHNEIDLIGVRILKRPAPVLVLFIRHYMNGFNDPLVGFNIGVAQVIQASQHIVMPGVRNREAQPAKIDLSAAS